MHASTCPSILLLTHARNESNQSTNQRVNGPIRINGSTGKSVDDMKRVFTGATFGRRIATRPRWISSTG